MISITTTHFPKIQDFYELNVEYFNLIREKYDAYKGDKNSPEFFASIDNQKLLLLIEVCNYINSRHGLFQVPILLLTPQSTLNAYWQKIVKGDPTSLQDLVRFYSAK